MATEQNSRIVTERVLESHFAGMRAVFDNPGMDDVERLVRTITGSNNFDVDLPADTLRQASVGLRNLSVIERYQRTFHCLESVLNDPIDPCTRMVAFRTFVKTFFDVVGIPPPPVRRNPTDQQRSEDGAFLYRAMKEQIWMATVGVFPAVTSRVWNAEVVLRGRLHADAPESEYDRLYRSLLETTTDMLESEIEDYLQRPAPQLQRDAAHGMMPPPEDAAEAHR